MINYRNSMNSDSKRKVLAVIGIVVGVVYIMNPTAGIIELIPDNIPFIGNLDEAGAVFLILKCLREFGIDPTKKKNSSDLMK